MNNIFVLNKNYSKIGTLSNQGARPQAPYYEDLFVQELETGADTYQFSTISSPYTQDILEIGNHIMFAYKNRNELFTITSLEYSHNEGYKTIGVYAEGIGFDLLEVYMERPQTKKSRATNDSDGDGDDNTDDEYADPDDVYIDENGNIIYDKNGSNEPNEEDVTIDGNGNIIYKPSKNNKKNDSLEFKNISYPTFLKVLLKNSGWSYTCQPGLESIKHDITVKYDTNIFAILQDSMQAYRGVELEFVHELVGGRVQKVIKAYKDGGRGSFVGKRFEYGKNVRGITKTQEVTDSEDDTILYIDNVGINVQYDVDFALKSAEVPEIEIGDTHYVIDRDFYPPMTIKARIGKIEISFSDPTVNKIYLANNKRISGSAIEDKFGADDVADMLDDYEYGDNGAAYDHYHDRLIPVPDHDHNRLVDNGTVFQLYGYSEEDERYSPELFIDYTVDSTPITEYILTDSRPIIPQDYSYDIGAIDKRWGRLYANESHCTESVGDEIRGSGIQVGTYYQFADNAVMENVNSISDSSDITKQDMYDFIVNEVKLYSYDFVNNLYVHPNFFGDYVRISNMIGVSAKDLRDTEIGNKWLVGNAYGYDPDGDGGGTFEYVYNLSNMIYMLLGAFQQHVTGGEPNNPSDPDDPSDSGGNTGNYATIAYVDNKLVDYATIDYVDNQIDGVVNSISTNYLSKVEAISDYATIEYVDQAIANIDNPGSGGGGTPGTGGGTGSGNLDGLIDAVEVDNEYTDTGKDIDLHVRKPTYFDGPIYMTGEWNSWGGASNHFTSIYGVGQLETMIINCDCWRPNDIYKDVTFYGDVIVDGTLTYKDIKPNSDISKKENIRYINNQAVQKENLETRNYSNEDLLEKADLHDFIVNQVNICEYNFIGDTANKIGFIANDYEGTKVGDKIVSKQEFKERNDDGEIIEISESLVYDVDNLLFATIGALQEEVRIKNEKIASLEDRLAKIEAMLGINNDN